LGRNNKEGMRSLRVGVLGCVPISQFARFEALRKAHSSEPYAICDVAEVLAEKMAAVHGPHDPAKVLRWIQAQRPHGNPSETNTRIAAERRRSG
jgi:hypothetical protein